MTGRLTRHPGTRVVPPGSVRVRRPAQPDPTVLEHVPPVRDGQCERHLLLRDQQRHTVPLELLERLERELRDLRSQTGRRLVEHQEPRPRHERASHGQHLLLTAAEGSRLLALSHLQPREEVVHELERLTIRPLGKGAQDEIALQRHRREEVPLGRDVRDSRARSAVRGTTGQILALEDDPALHRRKQPGDGPEERRLPRAVRADDRDRLTGTDFDLDAVDDPLAEVSGGQPVDLKQRGHARDTRRRPAGPASRPPARPRPGPCRNRARSLVRRAG